MPRVISIFFLILLMTTTGYGMGIFKDSSDQDSSTNPPPSLPDPPPIPGGGTRPGGTNPPASSDSQKDLLTKVHDGERSNVAPYESDQANCTSVDNFGAFTVFIPHKSPEEWNKFKNLSPTAQAKAKVALGPCGPPPPPPPPPGFNLVFDGACNHIKNNSYSNRSANRAYRMECSRDWVDINAAIAAREAEATFPVGKTIDVASLNMYYRQGRCIGHPDRSEDKIYTYTTNSNPPPGDWISRGGFKGPFPLDLTTDSFSTRSDCAAGQTNIVDLERPSPCRKNKWMGSSIKYDSATSTITASSAANGWGDCRETGCSVCVGEIVVNYTTN